MALILKQAGRVINTIILDSKLQSPEAVPFEETKGMISSSTSTAVDDIISEMRGGLRVPQMKGTGASKISRASFGTINQYH